MNRLLGLIILAATILFIVGCSSTSSPITPESSGEPSFPPEVNSQTPSAEQEKQRVIWGVFNLVFDPVNGEISAILLRDVSAHFNVTGFVTPPACNDCIGIFIEGFNPDGWVYDIRVTLRNPTHLTGYDVRGTLLIGQETDPRALVNVDEYTELFDNSTPPDRNPFKVFATDQPGRKFAPDVVHEVIYQISFPPPPKFNVLYVVDASWPGNQVEPFNIYSQEIDDGLDDAGVETVEVRAYVRDWQGDVESVKLDVTPLGAPGPLDLTQESFDMWTAELSNEWSAPAGEYELWIEAKSEGYQVLLYDMVPLTIIPYANTPPVWDDTIGIVSAMPGDESVVVTYGTASDPHVPITYVVYYSEYSPIDFGTAPTVESDIGSPTIVDGLTNYQTYHFAVRARDAWGLEENNTNELPATPQSGNQPPIWDDTIGVQSLTPLSEAMEVGFGAATDPDVPVTYNIYYSEISPIDFGTAPSINVAGSPGTVNNLDNAKIYFFAVRAMDGLGLEDDNTVELAGCPNLPPEWQGTVGITGVQAGFDFATVSFGFASDPDTPVTYNIYYSKNSPIDFGSAAKDSGVLMSPYIVKGLDNDETYHFAVRAEDAFGLEDTNTNEASAHTWPLPELKWVHPFGAAVFSSPTYNDVNGDNIDDIIVGGWSNNRVKALDGLTGDELWVSYTSEWVDSSPCLASIGGSAVEDILIGCWDGRLYAIDGENGSGLWDFPTGGIVTSSPAVADIDNDGTMEAVFGSMDGHIYAVETDGSFDWSFYTFGVVFSSPALCDWNNNGFYDVFIGSGSKTLFSFDHLGNINWTYPTAGVISSSPAVGDIDDDGEYEVVVASMDGYVYAVDMHGQLGWKFDIGGYIVTSPALGDLNGDGALDVALGADDTNFYLIDGKTGDEIWHFPSGNRIWSSAALVDLSGDGVMDVVVGSNDGFLWCINGTDGTELWSYDTAEWIDSSPAITDLDNDGLLDVVFGCSNGNVYCINTNAPVPDASLRVWPKFRRKTDNTGAF